MKKNPACFLGTKLILPVLAIFFLFSGEGNGIIGRADEPDRSFQIDFTQTAGPMKPLHGINNSPITWGEKLPELAEAGIPYVRLHDTAGAFGGTYFVDIPNIFPNADADALDPASYDFAFTDAYLKGLAESGVKIFYRLGVTIENHHTIKAYRIHPPKDLEKFAQICAGIVRHYNEGWADGFHYGIEYWEIWNEPENPPMWTGTREEYFEMYRVTANYLKEQFPNIKVGGYAGCGFYAVNRPNCNDFFKSFLTWFDAFLDYVTAEATCAPLDFYSWHLYTDDPEEIILHANYVDKKLKEHGLDRTENIFDEWNYMHGGDPDIYDKMKEMPGTAFTASALCLMQPSPIDKAMYYDALPQRTYGGLYYFPSGKVTKTYYSLWMFNKLYQLGTSVTVESSGRIKCYALAAKNSEHAAVLLVNNESEPKNIALEFVGAHMEDFSITLLDADHLAEKATLAVNDSVVVLPPLSVVLLEK